MNKNTVIIRKLAFGKFYMYENIIPCIELNRLNEDGTVDKTVGYLSAFRDYCFQVSGTWDGNNDKGSTPVFGLDTFGRIVQSGRSNLSQCNTIRYFISSIAMMAIVEFATKGGYIYPDRDKYNDDEDIIRVKYELPKGYNTIYYGANEEYKKFVEACFNRYVHRVSKVPGSPYYDEQLRQVVDVLPAKEA